MIPIRASAIREDAHEIQLADTIDAICGRGIAAAFNAAVTLGKPPLSSQLVTWGRLFRLMRDAGVDSWVLEETLLGVLSWVWTGASPLVRQVTSREQIEDIAMDYVHQGFEPDCKCTQYTAPLSKTIN